MYPHERSLVKHLAGKPFALIGVNSDGKLSIPQELAKTGEVTWRSFQNEGGDTPISKEWGVKGWPTIYVIDAEGKIRYHNVRGKKLDEAIATLLEEMGEEFPHDAIEATAEEERNREFGEEAEEEADDVDEDAPEEEQAEDDEDGEEDS